nr:myosin light chain kinase smooth muscle [Hymenolepis microstoma]
MLSKIKHRRAANQKDEDDEDDTKEFLLNRKVAIKENVNVDKEYKIFEFLGSGKFGDVNRCQEKSTGHELAAKVVPYYSSDEKEAVMNEVEIMCRLRHPRLIQLYDVFVQPDRITLIMELITGGELFERVIDESFELDEATCEKFMRQILQGVEYIHSQHIVHLDLKPENILCLSKTGFKIKIIDFGLAREVTDGELRVMFGTPEFVAPEVISFEPVTYATDMWSIGVVCYVLLSGLSPFMGDNEGETLSNIMRCNYTFNYPEFKDISSDAKDFIKALLTKNSQKRNTATQCLSHPWLKEAPKLKRTATVSKKRLRHFVYRRKWQKAVNAIIALQRMGVVLCHTQSKDRDYRKILQAKSAKTAALFKKSSIRGKPTTIPSPQDMKRNFSFSTASEADKQTKVGSRSISRVDIEKISNMTRPPQIKVTKPTQKEIQISALNNSNVSKPPSPNAIKRESRNIENNASKSAENPAVKDGKTSSVKPDKSSSDIKTNNSPKESSTNSVKQNNIARQPPPTKVEPPKEAKISPASRPNSAPLRQPTTSNPSEAEDQKKPIQSNSPRLSPSPTIPSTSSVNISGKSMHMKSSDQPVLLKMVTLNKSRGSVADRISFFNSSTESQLKSAKNKKFSPYY